MGRPGPRRRRVLDVAAGGGRHTRFFADRGNKVTAIDRDVSALTDSAGRRDRASRSRGWIALALCPAAPSAPWSSPTICIARSSPRCWTRSNPGGVLLYETFMARQRAVRAAEPAEFLLKDGELLELARDRLSVTAYEARMISEPKMAMIQRIAARKF